MNVLSLKRKTDEQKKEIEDTRARQNDLEIRLISQVATLNSAQHLTQHFYQGSGDASNLGEQVEKEESAGRVASAAEEYANRDDPYGEEEQEMRREMASMSVELLHQWEMIDARTNPQNPVWRSHSSDEHKALIEFARRHSRSINTIQAVRNSVAHSRPVPFDDLTGALDASIRLNRLLDDMGVPPF